MPDNYIEINTVDAVKTSANKLLMKQAFTEAGIKTATWWKLEDININELPYPVVLKHIYGSRGTGNTLICDKEDLEHALEDITNKSRYIIEKFYNYSREYRLHITSEGCFYTCRKMLKSDAENRWYRNNDNSVWILEDNEMFDKPINWDEIEEHCVRALNAVGLDVGACDVRVQSATDKHGNKRQSCNFIICEINSAPSLQTVGITKYKEILPKLIQSKQTT